MYTLPEITYDLLETIRNAKIVDDDNIDHRLLQNWVHNQRALWIKRKCDEIKDYDDNLIQTIDAELEFNNNPVALRKIHTSGILDIGIEYEILDLEFGVTDFINCGVSRNIIGTKFIATQRIPTSWGARGKLQSYKIVDTKDSILRTKDLMPVPIELNYGSTVLEVSSPNIEGKNFSFVSFGQLRWSGNGKFNTKTLFVAVRDGRWYVKYGKDNTSPYTIKNIVCRYILQNPTEAPGYDIDTSNYPVNRNMIDYMKDMILKSNVGTILRTEADETNDASGEVKQ